MHRYGDEVATLARPLRDAGDLSVLVDRAAGARVVLIGEASHGTHEFYAWRAALTRRLISERGFAFVAVEGDWPDCARVGAAIGGGRPGNQQPVPPGNRQAGPAGTREALLGYQRWPTWMWANEELADFTGWLAIHHPDVGFHGLDVYSLWQSLREILFWLREHDRGRLAAALAAHQCFSAYGEDPNAYAYATRFLRASCADDVLRLLIERRGGELDVWQNAECVAGAEHYYRAMMRGGPDSWNVRDRHMDATLARLLDHHGPDAKGVVWAHNTHVGDSRATDQDERGEVTLGRLARERFGADRVLLVGAGGHRGTVVAAHAWGAPAEVMSVPPAREDSLEDVLHHTAPPTALYVTPPLAERPGLLTGTLPHRAIGVVYRPERERWANYVPSVLGDRYDAFLWFDETRALRPLHTPQVDTRELETYPSGV